MFYLINRQLILSKISTETFCSCQCPWYWVLSKMSMLRKGFCVPTAHNIYFYFWFTHKTVLSCCLANNNFSCLSSLAGNATWGKVDRSVWTKYLNGHCGKWPNVLQRFYTYSSQTHPTFPAYRPLHPECLLQASLPIVISLYLQCLSYIKSAQFLQ